jgi:CheY-like chemotaxis protein
MLPEITGKLVKAIRREAQAANHVARQLLAFTKEQPVHVERLALRPFLEECLSITLMGSATSQSLELEQPELSFPTDPNLLFQVLTNLILNARQAQKNKGSVTISAFEREDGKLCLHVADRGPGIPSEEIDRIFDAYYSTKPTGSGLGLHVVSGILGRLGGTIELDRSYQRGARFVLIIPPAEVSKSMEPTLDSSDSGPMEFKPGLNKILLLEDDPGQVELLSTFFESLQIEYESFLDGKRLLERVDSMKEAEREIICCLLDITVTTGLGGLDILETLRKSAPKARIILISGYSDQWESNSKMLKKSNALFLPKPYSFAELEKKINGAS